MDQTQLDTHAHGKTPLDDRSARRRDHCLHSTQQTPGTNIHALSGIRTRNPSNQAATDSSLRPQEHRDRL
jgi:hypothetical protein